MKIKITLSLILALLVSKLTLAQTATNFTVNDCAGNPHNLFNELDAGKVVVLCWVMPCANCVNTSVITNNVVQSFQASNPNRVAMYLVDDYANTTCASLNSWATSNGLTNVTTFSNAAINMTHYGSTGMPKVVVLGGANHAVYYNANNSVNQTSLQNAITAALGSPTGVSEDLSVITGVTVFPNPSVNNSTLNFSMQQPAKVTAEIYNHLGQKVSDAFSGILSSGENQIKINTANLSNGVYFVNLKSEEKSKMVKMLVVHQ